MFQENKHHGRYNVSLAVSYMEIYKDEVYDLLVARENVSHPIVEPSASYTEAKLEGSETSSTGERCRHGFRRQFNFSTNIIRRRL